jgi:aerobic carbon-monoxide dehydrogenase large subunit
MTVPISGLARFGKSQVRVEDQRFLTGNGQYLDDISLPNQVYGAFVRSPHAHARVTSMETSVAQGMPGVHLIVTGAEWAAQKFGPLPCRSPSKVNRDGTPFKDPPRQCLAHETVRYVGEPLALVVAATAAEARRAADAVHVEYETLASVTDRAGALDAKAAQLWPEAPHNLCLDFEQGNRAAVEAALATAKHVIRLDMGNNRLTAVPMEPRGAIASYDKATGEYALLNSSQNIHANRDLMAQMLQIPKDKLRHHAPDIGGGFGGKNSVYSEPVVMLYAARKLGRPVKWVADRTEAFLTDTHGRDQQSSVALALDAAGKFLALHVQTIGNVGAACGTMGPFTPTGGSARTQGGPYAIPAILYSSKAVFTNTVQTDPYRGAGRPEAVFHIERVIEFAARTLGMDPIDLRRRNLIKATQMPYTSGIGLAIDCGDFPAVMDRVIKMSDRPGYAARVAASRAKGLRRGYAVTPYLECSGGSPSEEASVAFKADGKIVLSVGTHSTGMGHETALAQIVADRLGIDLHRIQFVQADTAATKIGGGHGGSRGIEVGGSAALKATNAAIDKARALAAHLLNSRSDDIVFDAGMLKDNKTGQTVTLDVVIAAAGDQSRVPAGMSKGALDTTVNFERENFTVPNGAHACEVEVDPETGVVKVDGFWCVDDFGSVINPMLADGQVMGGIVQGLGQALLEEVVYDRENGQLLTASLLEYALPRADHVPRMQIEFFEGAPTKRNPLGAKGSGEAGCCGATPVIVNAVLDALNDLGVRHIEMPLTSEKVWAAIRDAKG